MTEAMQAKVEVLAEAIVLLDPRHLPALADLHTHFEELQQQAQEAGENFIETLCTEAAQLIQDVILEDVPDETQALARVEAIVTSLQRGSGPGTPASVSASGNDVSKPAEYAAASSSSQTGASVPQPMALTTDVEVLAEFLTEAREHLEAADIQLLNIEHTPEDADALNALFRAFHTIKGAAGFLSLPEVQHLAHEAENLLDKARAGELLMAGLPVDVTFEAVDRLKALLYIIQACMDEDAPVPPDSGVPVLVQRIRDAASAEAAPQSGEGLAAKGDKPLGEILVEDYGVEEALVDTALAAQQAHPTRPKLGEILVQSGAAAAKDVSKALRSQKTAHAGHEPIRVDVDRLEKLVDLIGELVICEAMVSSSDKIRGLRDQDLDRHINQMSKTTRELQEMATSLRMVAVRNTFKKMARLVRDTAKKAEKQVEFVTSGEDTELDRTVIEKIGDPLMHMVRNAVDHGLEADAGERLEASKPEAGRIELRAYHKASNIYIEIMDDGRGLDRDAILAKAVDRGIVSNGAELSDKEVWNLIFAPGLSTAKQVTDVSGRGVGMDVVKRNIEALRGQIEVESEKGKGSTFRIRLPLTLAIIDGMVARVGMERYVLPTLSIVSAMHPKDEDLNTVLKKGEMVTVRGRLVPIMRLDRALGVAGSNEEATNAILVIVEEAGNQLALLVDELLGQQQIVIKSLEHALGSTKGVAGGAIMPDGTPGLILDIEGLVRSFAAERPDEALLGQN